MSTGPDQERPSAPHVLVVLGVTGDLARRKLFPALYRLWLFDLLPERFHLVCSARATPGGRTVFLATVREAVETCRGAIDGTGWQRFADRISFVPTTDGNGAELEKAIADAAKELGSDVRCIYYLAVNVSQ